MIWILYGKNHETEAVRLQTIARLYGIRVLLVQAGAPGNFEIRGQNAALVSATRLIADGMITMQQLSNQQKQITMKTIRKDTYTFEVIRYDDGTVELKRTNDAFNAFELLGLLEHAQLDILKQLAGEIKPDIIKRQVIEPVDDKQRLSFEEIENAILNYDAKSEYQQAAIVMLRNIFKQQSETTNHKKQ